MTTLFEITYEGHAAGASIGVESGWDNPSGTRVYDATYVAGGTMGAKITDQGIMRKTVTALASSRIRWYMQMPNVVPSATALIGSHRSGSTSRAIVRLQTSGSLQLGNVAANTGSPSATLTNNEPVRCEWWTNGGAGTQGLDIFRGANVDGATPDEQLSGTFTNATYDNMSASFPTSISGFIIYMDEVKATDVPGTQIGPSATSLESRNVLGDVAAVDVDVNYNLATGAIITATVTTPADRGGLLHWTNAGTPGTTSVPPATTYVETYNGVDPSTVSVLGVLTDADEADRL